MGMNDERSWVQTLNSKRALIGRHVCTLLYMKGMVIDQAFTDMHDLIKVMFTYDEKIDDGEDINVKNDVEKHWRTVNKFKENMFRYKMDDVMAFIYATELLGYYYIMDNTVRQFWYDVYCELVHELHLNVEPIDVFAARTEIN